MPKHTDPINAILTPTSHGVALRVKVVPGASRTRIAGLLGDRLKLTLAAPPQDGRANRAACKLLAQAFEIPHANAAVTAGATRPEKTITLTAVSLTQATETLRRLLEPLG